MDAGKVTVLFGELGPGDDPDDTEVRHDLVKERLRRDYPALDDGSPAQRGRRPHVPVARGPDR